MDKSAIVFGEILFDVFDDKAVIGGASYNFCHWFARLGGKAWLCSAVGNDHLGKTALDKMASSKVGQELMCVAPQKTGACIVTSDENGKPKYQLQSDVAYDHIQADVEKIKGMRANAFCFGTLIQRDEHNAKQLKTILANCKFDEILCDVNVREGTYTKRAMQLCLENATILKYSDDEEAYVKEFVGENVFDGIAKNHKNVKIVIRTMGENGAEVYDVKNNVVYTLDSKKVDVKSTVGCGDSYCAAFLYYYLSGYSIQECATHAKELSGYVATIQGAVE